MLPRLVCKSPPGSMNRPLLALTTRDRLLSTGTCGELLLPRLVASVKRPLSAPMRDRLLSIGTCGELPPRLLAVLLRG